MSASEPIQSPLDLRTDSPLSRPSVQAEITGANARFMDAFGAGDAAGVTACYTRDAQLLPAGNDAISGHDAITAFWRGGMAAGIAGARLESVEVEERGDLAVEVGGYTLLGADGGTIDHGKYLVVWRREEGAWRIHRDIWTTSVAPASA